jgi:hypothetical protein
MLWGQSLHRLEAYKRVVGFDEYLLSSWAD